MIQFIDENKDRFGVESICVVLGDTECGFITSRGYRKAKTRTMSARALSDSLLTPEIQRVHHENYSVYGVRKMWHAMRREGSDVPIDENRWCSGP